MKTTAKTTANESYVVKILDEGVCVFKNLISAPDIQAITNEINLIKEMVNAKIAGMQRPLKTYSDIAERHPGRLDYRCGFTAEIFEIVAKPIVQLIKNISPKVDFRYYWGAIPSQGQSGPT